ncbi:MAG: hypothetical protein LBS72_07820 [Oscillospiraceae bacterium]|jgi:hypothetical protein|nr:hypothetical protein [Oscillospiraceae bacterium]
METRHSSKRLSVALVLIGLLLVSVGIAVSMRSTQSENGALTAVPPAARIQAGSVLRQTLVYQRCGHQVARTVDTPQEWIGLTYEELQPKLDMAWRVTDFSPSEISMRENLMLFCPQHWVLMPDETGQICVWVNRYGEGLERVYETSWTQSHLPESARETVRIGKAFDLLEEAEAYLDGLID